MVLFAEINPAPPVYSMLQHIGKVASPKLAPRNCLRYLQTTFIMVEGDWSQSLCKVLSKKINERGLRKTWQFFELKHTVLDAYI